MKRHSHLIAFTGLLLSVKAAFAAHYPDPVFLSKDALSLPSALAPVPKPGSATDRQDFTRILDLQHSRTPQDCKRAGFVVDVSLKTLFGPEYGPLSAEEVRRWSDFFEKVRIDTDYFVQESKKLWGRPRPYFANAQVHPCVTREVTNAYPSGHAAISRVFARVLSELDPSRKEAFLARAEQIAADRVLAGVHHPTDIEAGKKLGDQVYARLSQDPGFKQALQRARQ